MIDRIVRRSYYEFVIIFTNRPPIVIRSSGNCAMLLEYLLNGTY